jgi:hypothetical protein
MRFWAKTSVIFAMCFVMTQGAKAIDWSEPFVAVKIPSGSSLYLGEALESGSSPMVAKVMARVVAKCPFRVLASFEGLRHEVLNVAISPKDMVVVINGKRVPVGKERVPIASDGPTPRNGVVVPIEMEVGVKTIQPYRAGRYGGALIIKVTPGS